MHVVCISIVLPFDLAPLLSGTFFLKKGGPLSARLRLHCFVAGIAAGSRLAEASCTVPEIASIAGHSLADVEAILGAHFLGRTTTVAVSGIAKLERNGTVKLAVKPSGESALDTA
jgi:hypothetical protein